jgi:DNA-directed RNA polymerase
MSLLDEEASLIREAFANFDRLGKWATYGHLFRLMDKKKIRLSTIIQIAEESGIDEDVIRGRRRYWIQLGRAVKDELERLDQEYAETASCH